MGASFATIFPSIPAMLRKDPTGNYDLLDSAPVASLGLADGYTMDAQTGAFAGEYEDFGSALVGACTGGLQNGCPVEGQLYDDGSFDVRILLDPDQAPPPQYLDPEAYELDEACLFVRCDTGQRPYGGMPRCAADVVWTVSPKDQDAVVFCVHIQMLTSDRQETLYRRYVFGNGSGVGNAADASGRDMAALAADALGFAPDFAAMLPSTIPYASGMLLRSVTCRPKRSAPAEDEPSVRVELALADSPAQANGSRATGQAHDAAAIIDDLVVAVGSSERGQAEGAFLEASGTLTLAGIPVAFSASYPTWQASIDVLPAQPVPLADIAAACGAGVPSALAKVALASGTARFALGTGGRRGTVDLANLDYEVALAFSAADSALDCRWSAGEAADAAGKESATADGAAVAFECGSVAVRRLGGRFEVRLRGDAAFRASDGSYLFGLGAEGALASGGGVTAVTLTAHLRPETKQIPRSFGAAARHARLATTPTYPSFASVYAALTGKQVPTGCPNIEITGLSATLEYASALSVKAFSGALRVSTADRSVFGCDLAFVATAQYRAGAAGGSGTTTLSGSFALEGRFAVGVTVTLADRTIWAFELILGSTRIGLAYASGKLTATIATHLTLGDAADALLRLFDPTSSFCRTGSWSFLNGIGLEGSSLVYDFSTKRLHITVTPRCSVPFLQMTGFTVAVDPSAGVTFEIVGTFDGTEYPADRPLSFSPNDPPQPGGNALKVDYLAVADGIDAGSLRTSSVEQALAQVESVLNASTDPAALVLDPKAGALMGAAFTVAQCAEVKLLYCGRTTFVGGRFRLFGAKAGPLAGLEAEFSYVKLNNRLGVFSAEFVPPARLRRIALGSLSVGVGRIAASVYTNGDFTIDLGFPSNGDFSRSFTLSYGVFDGAGGVYVKKLSTPEAGTVPATSRGRFSPVLQMGVGMRLALSKGFRAGILSASAYFSMQGLFEGVYATFVPYGSSGAASYYRLDATVVLEGRIQGSVNFGLIGAAVTVQASARAALRLEAFRAASVTVQARVAAQASIKIVFVRIRFSFDLSMSIDFALGSGGRAPWDASVPHTAAAAANALADGTGAHPLGQIEPPAVLRFPAVDADPRTIPCRIVPLYTVRSGLPAVAFMATTAAEDFASIVQALASFVNANDYLAETRGLELFNSSCLFSDEDSLDRFLGERFVFEYSFAEDPSSTAEGGGALNAGACTAEEDSAGQPADAAGAETDVLMPLPGWFVQTVTARYATGVTDVSQEDLSSCFMVDDAFVQSMRDYYAATSEDNAQLAKHARDGDRAQGEGAARSLAAKMFDGYFELLVKAIRATKESEIVRGRHFDAEAISDEQMGDIAGAAQHFFLGGHRVLEDAAHLRMPTDQAERRTTVDGGCDAAAPALVGNFEAAGELMYLDAENAQLAACTYSFSPSEGCPAWVRLRDGSRITRTVDAASVRSSLPATAFSDDSRFAEIPAVRAFFEDAAAPRFSLPATCCVEDARLFDAGAQMVPGLSYAVELPEGAAMRYVGLCTVSLLSCAVDPPLFAIVGANRTKSIGLWRSAAAKGQVDSIYLAAVAAEGEAPNGGIASSSTSDDGCYLLKGADGAASERVYAPLKDAGAWLALLERACAAEEPFYLGYPTRQSCPFADRDELDLRIVVRHTASDVFPSGFDTVEIRPCSADWVELVPPGTVRQAVVPQGRLAVTALTNGDALPEAERALYDRYGNMAVRRSGGSGHETPPFAAHDDPTRNQNAENDRRLTAYVPYALEDDDPYAAVRAGRELSFEVLWIDVLGNCMPDETHVVSYAPRYIDDVMGFGAYAGMQAGFRLEEAHGEPVVAVELRYAPATPAAPVEQEPSLESAHAARAGSQRTDGDLADAVLQLEQPDVSITLSSPLCGEVAMDKEAWLEFLRAVRDDPAASRTLSLPHAVAADVPALVALEAEVVVARDGSLVDPEAPASVQEARTKLAYADGATAARAGDADGRDGGTGDGGPLPTCLRHTFADIPASAAVYEGPDGCWALLSCSPPLSASSPHLYAYRPLPLASGLFCAPDQAPHPDGRASAAALQMNAVDLQQILDTFLADLAFLLKPAQLCRFATSDALRPQLDELYRLRSEAGAAVAQHLMPLAAEVPPARADEAARRALAASLTLCPDLDLANALAVGMDVEHRVPAECGLAVHGLVGEGAGMPTRVRADEATLGFVMEAEEGAIDCSTLSFQVRRLRSGAQAATEWLTPRQGRAGFDTVPLGLSARVSLPGRHRPAAPVLVTVVPSAAETTVVLDIAPFGCDRLEFFLNDAHAPTRADDAAVPSPLYWMERYRQDSPALVKSESEQDTAALVSLMRSYLDALVAYGEEVDQAARRILQTQRERCRNVPGSPHATAASSTTGHPAADSEDPSIAFEMLANKTGSLAGVSARGLTDRIVSIACRPEGGAEVKAERDGNRFVFLNDTLPREGGSLALSVVFANPESGRPCGGRVQLAYRPSAFEQQETNPVFNQVSAALSF